MTWRTRLRRPGPWLVLVPAVVVLAAVVGPFVYTHFIEGDPPERLTFSSTPRPPRSARARSPATGWTRSSSVRAPRRSGGPRRSSVHSRSGATIAEAAFEVDLTTVASDQDRRGRQFHGRIMDTARFPTATFRLTQPIELGSPPDDLAEVPATATGELTVRGATRTVACDLLARRNGSGFEVNGSIPVVRRPRDPGAELRPGRGRGPVRDRVPPAVRACLTVRRRPRARPRPRPRAGDGRLRRAGGLGVAPGRRSPPPEDGTIDGSPPVRVNPDAPRCGGTRAGPDVPVRRAHRGDPDVGLAGAGPGGAVDRGGVVAAAGTDLFAETDDGQGGWSTWTWRIVRGFVLVDPQASVSSLPALLLRELGQAVGLGPVEDEARLTYPTPGSTAADGTGDLAALAAAGRSAACVRWRAYARAAITVCRSK